MVVGNVVYIFQNGPRLFKQDAGDLENRCMERPAVSTMRDVDGVKLFLNPR
jgi:hypothetical protein